MIAPQTAAVPSFETDRLTILTPKGEATRAAYTLARALRALSPADRDDVLCLFAQAVPSAA